MILVATSTFLSKESGRNFFAIYFTVVILVVSLYSLIIFSTKSGLPKTFLPILSTIFGIVSMFVFFILFCGEFIFHCYYLASLLCEIHRITFSSSHLFHPQQFLHQQH